MLPLVGTDVPVVFCGMNGQPESYSAPKHIMDSRSRRARRHACPPITTSNETQ